MCWSTIRSSVRNNVPPWTARLYRLVVAVSPGGPHISRRAGPSAVRHITDERRRAIFGFIQTGFTHDTGAVAVWPPLDDEVLRFGGEAVTYRELLLTGAMAGLLARVVLGAAAGERLLRSSPDGPSRDAVRAEAKRFRLARHLESGEDLRAWLASRELTLDEFDQYLSRAVARAGPGSNGPDGEPAAALHAEAGELGSKLLFAELAFSGAWRSFADSAVRLFAAERVARQGNPDLLRTEGGRVSTSVATFGFDPGEVSDVLRPFGTFDPSWCGARLEVLGLRARLLDDIEQQVRGSEGVEARLRDYRVDWALYRYDELVLRSRAAAMEALSCARVDGLAAGEIARRAGAELMARRARREELPAGHAALLDGALQDEAVGPVGGDGGFSVLWLHHRASPDGADHEMTERAVGELLSEVLERAATGSVLELGQL